MMNVSNTLRLIYKRVLSIINRWLRLITLQVISYTAAAASVVLSQLILILLWSMSLFCLLAGATVWLIAYSGSTYLALLGASVALFALLMLMYLFRNAWINKPIQDAIARNIN